MSNEKKNKEKSIYIVVVASNGVVSSNTSCIHLSAIASTI
jgi:hypothetical protein